jgi:hypothetical protein
MRAKRPRCWKLRQRLLFLAYRCFDKLAIWADKQADAICERYNRTKVRKADTPVYSVRHEADGIVVEAPTDEETATLFLLEDLRRARAGI